MKPLDFEGPYAKRGTQLSSSLSCRWCEERSTCIDCSVHIRKLSKRYNSGAESDSFWLKKKVLGREMEETEWTKRTNLEDQSWGCSITSCLLFVEHSLCIRPCVSPRAQSLSLKFPNNSMAAATPIFVILKESEGQMLSLEYRAGKQQSCFASHVLLLLCLSLCWGKGWLQDRVLSLTDAAQGHGEFACLDSGRDGSSTSIEKIKKHCSLQTSECTSALSSSALGSTTAG
jgi:hypothetical protein